MTKDLKLCQCHENECHADSVPPGWRCRKEVVSSKPVAPAIPQAHRDHDAAWSAYWRDLSKWQERELMRLHNQLLEHSEVCGESAYPISDRVAVETTQPTTDCRHDWVSIIGGIRCVLCGVQIAARCLPEEPEPRHTGVVHAGGPHTIHEGSRADCAICSPPKQAWDCACNKPECAYCGPRLAENGDGDVTR